MNAYLNSNARTFRMRLCDLSTSAFFTIPSGSLLRWVSTYTHTYTPSRPTSMNKTQ